MPSAMHTHIIFVCIACTHFSYAWHFIFNRLINCPFVLCDLFLLLTQLKHKWTLLQHEQSMDKYVKRLSVNIKWTTILCEKNKDKKIWQCHISARWWVVKRVCCVSQNISFWHSEAILNCHTHPSLTEATSAPFTCCTFHYKDTFLWLF